VALTDDQKAMLRLLAQREDGYEEMAALKGISVEELRQRVQEALAEVDRPAARTSGPRPPRISLPKLPEKNRGPIVGIGAGVLALLALVIVLIVGGDGGGTSSGSTSGESTTASSEANPSLTEAVLVPTDGGAGSGKALFGRFKKNVLLQVEAEGLEPSPQGKAYTIWLYRSPKIALQVGAVPVDDSGKIATQLKIPAQLLAYVASGAFNQVDVGLTDTAEYQAALAKAKGEKKLPPYTGESVLRGEITGPAIEAQ